jgi:hypothetical protein
VTFDRGICLVFTKATANRSVGIHVQGAYLISSNVGVSSSKLSARSEKRREI